MASYQTVNLKLDVVARARAVADERRVPLATLLADLVNEAYEKIGGSISKVALVETHAGAEIVIALQDEDAGERHVRIPKKETQTVVDRILAFASPDPRERGYLDLDLPCCLSVGRRGAAVVISGIDDQGESVCETMSVHDAKRLAAEIKSYA
ncbi:hypothetical protein AB6806_08980 [Bosea sp. RCC_152_1]|uniref:hypothetical protein n=1 Tax=Bosea sp. RCC_152_1 TaxID=3239228 RepID=UPI003523C3CD